MANKTVELKVLVDPDVRSQIDKVRGRVPMSTWLRDAAQVRMRAEEALRKVAANMAQIQSVQDMPLTFHVQEDLLRHLLEDL